MVGALTAVTSAYGIIVAVAGLGVLFFLSLIAAHRRRDEHAGEINQQAKDLIAEINAAVQRGDDAAVQAALLKHLRDSK